VFISKRIYGETGDQSELAFGNRAQSGRSATRKLALTSAVLALTSLPVLVGAPAQASTTANGCTVTPRTATVTGLDQTGHKIVDYRVTATCVKGVSLTVEQQAWEYDGGTVPAAYGGNLDQYQLFISQTRNFSTYGGTIELHVTRTLDKTDSDPNEEPYQKVRFRVVSIDTLVISAWSKLEAVPYVQIPY
jgi:hypothetical protein